jgi:hypothetical protein
MEKHRRNVASSVPLQQPPPKVQRAGLGTKLCLSKTGLSTDSSSIPPAPHSPSVTPRLPPSSDKEKILRTCVSDQSRESKVNLPTTGISALEVDATIRRSLQVFGKDQATVVDVLHRFVEENSVVLTSSNLQNGTHEDDLMGSLLILFSQRVLVKHSNVCLLALKSLKILLRKDGNRQIMSQRFVQNIISIMECSSTPTILTECANVCLNMCYEADNVEKLIDNGGIDSLVRFLGNESPDLQASAAGAIQSVCFQEYGRGAVRETNGAIEALVQLMNSENSLLQARAVGAIHNISGDALSIHILREVGAIEILVKHLSTPTVGIPGSAAGALQNISREVASQSILAKDARAVELLADLLFGSDTSAMACAVGALMNILGPELGVDSPDNKTRNAFKSMLSDSIAMGTVWQTCFEDIGL